MSALVPNSRTASFGALFPCSSLVLCSWRGGEGEGEGEGPHLETASFL